jgi:hypothetical protein
MPRSSETGASRALSVFSAVFLSVALLLTAFVVSAKADGFRIVRLVNGMNRPDLPCPPCTPFYIFYTPVISGDRVAFLSRNGPPDGVWSGDINTRALTKLAGLNTPVPGGSGNFSAFYGGSVYPITIGGTYVAFFGADGAGVLGLYTVPVTGGAVRKIATTNTIAPDGTEFTDLRFASLNGPTVVFWGRTPDHIDGIYRATRLGTQLQTVIDSDDRLDARTPAGPLVDYFSGFPRAVIGRGSNIAFYAGGLFDPVSGPNAIFRSTLVDIADNMTGLQGRPDNSHVRIGNFSAAVGSAAIAFFADQPNNGFQGLFKVRGKFIADAFVTNQTVAPPTARKFSTFYGFGYDDTGLAFTGIHPIIGSTVDQSVYFVAAPGQPVVKVAAGHNYYLPMVGDRSVSQGRIVFMEGSNYADTVFVAVPVVP